MAKNYNKYFLLNQLTVEIKTKNIIYTKKVSKYIVFANSI